MRPSERDLARNRRIAMRLEAWFAANARDFPWRRNRTPYTALVAELMLQQTQAVRAAERFDAFCKRFPTFESLAAADEQEVLAAWQGLGYYRRARLLHAAAREVVARHGGSLPRDFGALHALPGVGRYTAGSLASIVFGERAPIVDGNVTRVLARLFARDEQPDSRESISWQWRTAESLVNACADPALLNEGLMELGAAVCTPALPRCAACPLSRFCEAKRSGRQHELPPPRTPAPQRDVHHHAVIVSRPDGCVLFEQRPRSGLWSSMWQVPTIESDDRMSAAAVRRVLQVGVRSCRHRGSFEYQTTHRRIQFHIHEARVRDAHAEGKIGVWRSRTGTADLPMSNAQRRILAEYG